MPGVGGTSAFESKTQRLMLPTDRPPLVLPIQSAEAGLHPVVVRLGAIHSGLLSVNFTLHQAEASPTERFEAYQRFKLLDAEHLQLEG